MELPIESKSKRRSNSTSLQSTCIFCGNESGHLHHCSTFNLDQELKQMATELQDISLLSKNLAGHLISIEVKYHIKCLVAFKNRYRSIQRALATQNSHSMEEIILQARVFSELISHIEGEVENGIYM